MRIKIKDLPPNTKVEKDELKHIMGGSWWGDIVTFFTSYCNDIPGESSLEGDYSETCYDYATNSWYQK